jgi:hypothetical protein
MAQQAWAEAPAKIWTICQCCIKRRVRHIDMSMSA